MSNDKLKVIKEESKNEPVPPPPVPTNECRADCPKGTCKNILTPQEVEKLLKKREEELNAIFEERMKKEINSLKERCDFVLLNEQIRASHMLCEAHRERQEKITALQTQLECKNLAGLMYVMCTERRRSTLEKLRMKEEYTNYIRALQGILTEAQDLILHLSRGYKTAARVDQEWRDKMVIVLKEFQKFIYDYTGGTPETNQYFFDMPRLLSTDASIVDDPKEDPCDCADEEQKNLKMAQPVETDEDKPWWEQLDGDCRPFLMFGDMAEFNPDQRREVLNTVKATKTAPAKWKRYVFNEMFLNSECNNADVIKDEYLSRVPLPEKFECYYGEPERKSSRASLTTPEPHRVTLASIDMRGNMGSILKLITSNTVRQTNSNRATILGARDSMEIASTTKLRVKHKSGEVSRVVINVGARRASMFDEGEESWDDNEIDKPVDAKHTRAKESEEKYDEANSLGMHTDSLQVGIHTPDHDHKINYEKVCPMEKCKRMQVDSFIRSLPPYMRASPFMHFEQTFDEYETCSPEQIEILKQRIENKKKKDKEDSETELEKDPLDEWTHIEGIATQTSDMSLSLPPCTCFAPSPTPVGSEGRIYNIEDLFPMKQAMDEIHNKFFFDDNIQFNRFKVIGEDSKDTFRETQNNENTTRNRLFEITKVLRRHPSLLDIFQANTQC